MTDLRLGASAAVSARRAPYVPALDGLRGVAIAGVLLFHTGHLAGGFLGVDLFFVLSGFLITDLLVREARDTGRIAVPAFWGRRARRLVPAQVTMVVVVTAVVWAVAPADVVRSTLDDGPWVQVDLVNWHLIAESAGYWDRFGPGRVFEHLWSIAVEEQFYLVWPLLVAAVVRGARRPSRGVALLAATVAAGSVTAMLLLSGAADPTRAYTGTDTRASSILMGAIVAAGPPRAALAALARRWPSCLAVASVSVLGVLWWRASGTDTPWLFNGGLLGHSVASAVLIVVCAQAPLTPVARALAWRPLRWLGRVSYGVYLWHWPVIVLLSVEATWLAGWLQTAVACSSAVGLAALSKYAVEDPIRFRAPWARGRTGVAALALVMVGLGLLWLWAPAPAVPVIDLDHLG